MYKVYVCKVKNIRPAENADRLNSCEVYGNTTIVDKTVNENDLYLYFPIDGQISEEFGRANDLFRRKDKNGNQCGGFIDPIKRNITAIKLRGNKSDGLVLPLNSLKPFGSIDTLKEGDTVEPKNKVMQAKLKSIVESWYEGPDLIDPRHIREGVVVRIVNRPKFTAYKSKNFNFKVLEGIIKDIAEQPDMEEAQELIRESCPNS